MLPSSSADGDGLRTTARLLGRGLLALAAALLVFPLAAPLPPDYLLAGGAFEYGWAYGINLAAASGWSFGSDIVFFVGPLGWLLFPTKVGSHLELALAFRVALLF